MPASLVLDGKNHLFVADSFNSAIREIVLATGRVISVAGPEHGLRHPRSVALLPDGSLLVGDDVANAVFVLERSQD